MASLSTEVDLGLADVLCERGARIRHAYFPHSGLISLSMPDSEKEGVEVGRISREGAFGVAIAVGASISPTRAVVQGAGNAARLRAAEFAMLLNECLSLRQALFIYTHGLLDQASRAAACNAHHPVRARLARWLLTTSDGLQANTMSSTQSAVATSLGVLRPAISHAAGELQRIGLIIYRRGRITIIDRVGLAAEACVCYEIGKRLYRSALR